jgi:hypothetical protein
MEFERSGLSAGAARGSGRKAAHAGFAGGFGKPA